jgi:S-adenosyl methyltransferase
MSFFDGLQLVPPGVVPVRGWEGDGPLPVLEPRQGSFLAGVGRKRADPAAWPGRILWAVLWAGTCGS